MMSPSKYFNQLTAWNFTWWFTWNIQNKSNVRSLQCTDGASFAPDILCGFLIFMPARFHDFSYRGKPIPGYGPVQTRWEGDRLFCAYMSRQIWKDSVNLTHLVLGMLCILPLYILGVRIGGIFAFQKRVSNGDSMVNK